MLRRLAVIAAAPAFAAAAAVKVLPLGDSITFGCGDSCGGDCSGGMAQCNPCSGGYRTSLWRQLDAATPGGWEFVGTQTGGPKDIDQHHEGHPGWTCEQINKISNKWAPTAPDAVLLHLGTNNMGIGLQSAATALTHMNDLVDAIFTLLPDAKLFLATLIGSGPMYGGNKHAEYNDGIRRLVANRTAQSIVLVDMAKESGIGAACDAQNCCGARIHPNDKGYVLMGDVWYKHLAAAFAPARGPPRAAAPAAPAAAAAAVPYVCFNSVCVPAADGVPPATCSAACR